MNLNNFLAKRVVSNFIIETLINWLNQWKAVQKILILKP